MTDPLIDRDSVVRAVQSGVPIGSVGHVQPITDAVLAYLRSVLTPEALYPQPGMVFDGDAWVTRNDMHSRIFGEVR